MSDDDEFDERVFVDALYDHLRLNLEKSRNEDRDDAYRSSL